MNRKAALRKGGLVVAGALLLIAIVSAIGHPGTHLKSVGSKDPAIARATVAGESRPSAPPATGPLATASEVAQRFAISMGSATWKTPSAEPEAADATPALAAAIAEYPRLTAAQITEQTTIVATVVNVLGTKESPGVYRFLITLRVTTSQLTGQFTRASAMQVQVGLQSTGAWLVTRVLTA